MILIEVPVSVRSVYLSIVHVLCAAWLVACGSAIEPAEHALGDLRLHLSAVSPDAQKYAPERLDAVQRQLTELQTRFDRQDYAAVVSHAPEVFASIQSLSTATAARRTAAAQALEARWAALVGSLPKKAQVIQERIEALARPSAQCARAAVDLPTARAELVRQASIWSKAQAAFATGNMSEAVSIGERLEAHYQALAATLDVDLPTPSTTSNQ
jgi:hypothetical protein